MNGHVAFVLHAHLPYVVGHGRWPHGVDWLHEAAAETYLPLLGMLEGLVREGLSPKITLSLSPVLADQLCDERFRDSFPGYLRQRIEAADEDARRFSREGNPPIQGLAERWGARFARLAQAYEAMDGDLLGRFRELEEGGHIELVTCAATHGYLPLLAEDRDVRAQIRAGAVVHERHFGRPPQGIWLPEMAYRPAYEWQPPVPHPRRSAPYPRRGIDELLGEEGFRYFLVDTPLLRGGKAAPVYLARFRALRELWQRSREAQIQAPERAAWSPYRPYLVAWEGGPAVFVRDPVTGLQVWSGEWGYPGDGWYLEFHKQHFPGGHRYWRVTESKSDLAAKDWYVPERAQERVHAHADHFVDLIARTLREEGQGGIPGILVAPFDAELFGHWWFEGVEWLGEVLRRLARGPEVATTTLSAYLERYPPLRMVELPEGSWGEGGFHWIWLNERTRWTWERIYAAEAEWEDLLPSAQGADELLTRVLRQAARELLLLEASDWQFLISTWSAQDYACARFARHFEDFVRLARLARQYAQTKVLPPGEWNFLEECEDRDRPFPDLSLDWWG